MGNGLGLKGFRALAIALLVAAPATAYAHARLVAPKPRNNDDGIKVGPCGNVPRTTAFTQYDAGATVTVRWKETIDHSGCFDILFSPANDQNWLRLRRIQDNAGTPDASYTTTVQLPPGVTCANCTLALRQIMMAGGAVCNATTPDEMDGGPPTYFSCADIRVGDFPDAAPSADAGPGEEEEDASSSGGSSGTSTTPTDGGGKTTDERNASSPSRNLRAGQGDDGCSVGWGATSGLSLFVSAGFVAMALARRRRRLRR